MKNPNIKLIGVVAKAPAEGLNRLFAGISANFPVQFANRRDGEYQGLDAVVLLGADRTSAEHAIRAGISCYAELLSDGTAHEIDGTQVQFATNLEVPTPFRGRALGLFEKPTGHWVEPTARESVVASIAGKAVWTQSTENNVRAAFVALKAPELAPGQFLFHYFSRINFLNLLPMIDFVRFLTRDPAWVHPPTRACLMFDDPNLHWKTYGFIDFSRLGSHAAQHNYHAAIATIPLDAWYVHPAAARLFREHSDRLSLLIHGNDHARKELAGAYSDEQRTSLLREALWRIEKLEEKTKLKVCRVMAPPHGACAQEMIVEMKRAGFEAACISRFSLRAHNSDKPWLNRLGLAMTEMVLGLPVMSRFRISKECHNSILLAAYLNQPIIAVGHHQEAAGGMQLLAETAGLINSLGKVRWDNCTNISRSNYDVRHQGERLHIKMYARRVEVHVQQDVNEIRVEGPWLNGEIEEPLEFRTASQSSQRLLNCEPTPLALKAGERLEIACVSPQPGLASKRPRLGIRFGPFLRRQLTECRDRLKPFIGV